MKKLIISTTASLFFALAAGSTSTVYAGPGKAAGPDPTITIETNCIKQNGEPAPTNPKFSAIVPPNMKNAMLVSAMDVADAQTACFDPDVSVPKATCVVTRTTPSGVEHVVYEAYRSEDCDD